MEISLELANTVPEFEAARGRLGAFFRSAALSDETIFDLDLIVEEALLNIVSYAYPAPGVGRVFVDARVDRETVTLQFRDSGAPFNPLDQAKPDLDAAIEDRPIGGLGVFLTVELASHVDYERREGSNVFTVTKQL